MLTNKWTEKSEEEKKKGRKYFQSYRGWFLVLSMNECHISYEGHTVIGWHFLRDYLRFKFERSQALLIWSELQSNKSWVTKFQRARILRVHE